MIQISISESCGDSARDPGDDVRFTSAQANTQSDSQNSPLLIISWIFADW